jgi:spore maturation protein CgeB
MWLPRTFYIGGYWNGANDMVHQMLLGLQSLGAEVCVYNTDENRHALDFEERPYDRGTYGPVWLRWEALAPPIEQFRPDLIVCNAGGLSFPPDIASALRRSTMLLGIALSDPDVFPTATSRIAPNFHLFATNAESCVQAYRSLGANAIALPYASNPAFFHPLPRRPEFNCEVLVIGHAHWDRIEAVRRLSERFRLHIHGPEWERHGLPGLGALYGDDLLRALNSARISLVFPRTLAGHRIPKVAVFDFIAAGALVATERIRPLERYFEYDREIIGFNDTDELIGKVRYYLDNPDQAQTIRAAGHRRVLEHHTWSKVWMRLIEQLQGIKDVIREGSATA